MRFLRQSLTGLFLLALTLGLLAFAGQMISGAIAERMARDTPVPPARERVLAVNVVRAEAGRVTPELTAFGQIESRRTLDLRASAGGRVIWLAPEFTEGGQVTAGQALLRIDPADAQSALDRAASDVADAEAEGRDAARALALARDELAAAADQAALRERALDRQRDLESRRVGTTAAVETAELAASTARAAVLTRRQAVAQAETRVDQAATRLSRASIVRAEAQRRLDDTEITAAFDGTLSGVTLVEGGIVTANERVAQLVDGAALEVALRISTPQYARLLDADGLLTALPVTVTLTVLGVDLEARGTLSRDSAAVGAGQTGRLIFASLDGARGFKPGDFVTVRVFEPALDNIVTLPATALGSDGTVLALGPDDRLQALAVTLERRQGDLVLLRGAELAGREVVRERTQLLGAGIKVRPLRDTGAPIAAEDPEMVELSDDQRARLVAFVEGNSGMPAEIKSSILARLQQPRVPADMVARLESRMGG